MNKPIQFLGTLLRRLPDESWEVHDAISALTFRDTYRTCLMLMKAYERGGIQCITEFRVNDVPFVTVVRP